MAQHRYQPIINNENQAQNHRDPRYGMVMDGVSAAIFGLSALFEVIEGAQGNAYNLTILGAVTTGFLGLLINRFENRCARKIIGSAAAIAGSFTITAACTDNYGINANHQNYATSSINGPR